MHGNLRSIPFMIHQFEITKADSGMTIELFPEGLDEKLVILIDYERMPTYKAYQYGAMASDSSNVTIWNTEGGKLFKQRLPCFPYSSLSRFFRILLLEGL